MPRKSRRRGHPLALASFSVLGGYAGRVEELEPKWMLIASPTDGLFSPPTTEPLKDQKDPAVAKATSLDPLINGDFVIVWEHEFNSPTDQGNTDIRGRLYDANGLPKGADFVIANTALDEQDPRVAMASDGSFIVTWEQENDNGDFDVAYRRFNASGGALDPPGQLVHPADAETQADPDIACFVNGDFVIVWLADVGDNNDIFFRRFRADGTALDNNPRPIADETTDEFLPRVAASKTTVTNDFTFTVTYTFEDPDGQLDIYRDLRRFSNGNTISGRIIVTDDDDIQQLDQVRSSVSMDATGRAVITWSQETTSGNHDIFYKRFEADGDPLDPQLRRIVTASASQNTNEHEVSMSNGPLFIVVFQISNGTGGTIDVRFRTFNFDEPDQLGRTELPIDPAAFSNITGPPDTPLEPFNQDNPTVAMNGTGEFTIVWDDDFNFPITRQDIVARNYRNTVETAGLYQPSSALYFLRNSNTTGSANIEFPFGIVTANPAQRWIPFEGDFDGDGVATVGVYDPVRALFYLRNSNTTGTPTADVGPLNFGMPNWIPIAGDWDGDGVATIGAYSPSLGRFFLRNSNTTGTADVTFRFGTGSNHLPVTGDWDGDGLDTVGLYNTSTGRFQLTNQAATDNDRAEVDLQFTVPLPVGKPVSGDYDRDGKDGVGVYVPGTSSFRLVAVLPNNNGSPTITNVFNYGVFQEPTWIPIMGDWNGPIADPLTAAEAPLAPSPDVARIDTATAAALLPAAIDAWVGAGLDGDLSSLLAMTTIAVGDLGANRLAQATPGTITVDDDAAGRGWFVDLTPSDDEEFAWIEGRLRSTGGAAEGRYDLLSVLAHELGHLLGLDHDESGDGVMSEELSTGIRRLPTAAAVDELLSQR